MKLQTVKKKILKKRPVIILSLIILVILVSLSSTIYFYQKYQSAKKLLQNPQETTKAEVKILVSAVGKLMELPKDEDPTPLTVTDKNRLKSQPFFANAENGDKVLIYEKNRMAILYRPSTNKIIEVSPISVNNSNVSPSPSMSQQPKKIKVAIYNGTKIADLAGKTASEISGNVTNVEIAEIGNTYKNYKETLVIDLTGNNKSVVDQVATLLKGKSSTLPDGEKKPQADILVVVGQ